MKALGQELLLFVLDGVHRELYKQAPGPAMVAHRESVPGSVGRVRASIIQQFGVFGWGSR